MKNTKKILALVLTVVLALAVFSTAAFAATINVQNVLDGETYTATKILNYESASGGTVYYLSASEYATLGSALETAGFVFNHAGDGRYVVTNAETIDIPAAAASLASANLGTGLGQFTAVGASGEANFTGMTPGYYFVSTTTGSICALHSDEDIEELVEKNTVPSVEKTEKVSTESSYVAGPIDANIGDTINYQIVVTDGVGTDKQLTMTDTMGAGLTYKAGTIKINGTAVADDASNTNYTVTVSGQTIEIVFTPTYVGSIDTNGTITVTYDATLNENAEIDDTASNTNKNFVDIAYAAQHDDDQVFVATYDLTVTKVDGAGSFVDGAEFKLYNAATGGNEITLVSDGNGGYYPSATGSANIDVNSSSGATVYGLAPGTYYLEEVVTPAGYNPLAARQSVTISTANTTPVSAEVINQAGAELPSTGGIGTTIFYIVGAILVLGAGILLIAKRRSTVSE